GSVTTERDREAAAWLNEVAKLPEGFWKDLFLAKSDLSGEKLTERIEDDFAWFVLGGKKVGIAQIEMIGAQQLIDERGAEITSLLEKLKREMHLDSIFQNTIELAGTNTFFVTSDEKTKQLLEKVFTVRFIGAVAEYPSLIMRKEIVPLLKAALEKE
ncbi:hypothetical protein HY478_01600, partial [Candidatus Uhrbacteria bacterium]|nr:hypothetical protein [Candidatus Uhrbacteria bacterium]